MQGLRKQCEFPRTLASPALLILDALYQDGEPSNGNGLIPQPLLEGSCPGQMEASSLHEEEILLLH